MTLVPAHVYGWFRTTDALGDEDVASAVAVLSDDERTRHMRFVCARDRRDYAAAHALLRQSLSRFADVMPAAWQFTAGAGGKPSLVGADRSPPLSFNLAHTHGLVACAISAGNEVGIDVEAVDRVVDQGVAERVFSAAEMDDLRSCPIDARPRRFFERWTLKEAFVKAIGKGLSHPFDTIAFDLTRAGSIVFTPDADIDPARWQFVLFAPATRYCLAVAVQCATGSSVHIDVASSDGVDRLRPTRTSRTLG